MEKQADGLLTAVGVGRPNALSVRELDAVEVLRLDHAGAEDEGKQEAETQKAI